VVTDDNEPPSCIDVSEAPGVGEDALEANAARATVYAVLSSPCPKADREDTAPCPETSASLSISATTTPFERPMVDGVPKRNVEAAEMDSDHPEGIRIRHIEREDLLDDRKLLSLYDLYAEDGVVGKAEADRLEFVACAEASLRKAKDNPGGLFAERLKNWSERRRWYSHRDEERARRRLPLKGGE